MGQYSGILKKREMKTAKTGNEYLQITIETAKGEWKFSDFGKLSKDIPDGANVLFEAERNKKNDKFWDLIGLTSQDTPQAAMARTPALGGCGFGDYARLMQECIEVVSEASIDRMLDEKEFTTCINTLFMACSARQVFPVELPRGETRKPVSTDAEKPAAKEENFETQDDEAPF